MPLHSKLWNEQNGELYHRKLSNTLTKLCHMFSFIIHTVRQPVSLKKLALRRCAQCRDSIKMIAVGGISVTRKWNEDNGTFKSHSNIKWKSIRFAIGGDGKVYEGRGFNVVGAHSPKYNDISIGICLIGNWEGKQTIYFFLLQIILLVKSKKKRYFETQKNSDRNLFS